MSVKQAIIKATLAAALTGAAAISFGFEGGRIPFPDKNGDGELQAMILETSDKFQEKNYEI